MSDDKTPSYLERWFPDASKLMSFQSPKCSELASTCLFVLDANALLAPYKVGEKSFKDIEQIYRRLVEQKRLYVPGRAIREFAKNRTAPLRENYDQLVAAVKALENLKQLRCPMLEKLSEYDTVVTSLTEITSQADDCKKKLKRLMGELRDWSWTDPITSAYANLFTSPTIIEPAPAVDIEKNLDERNRYALPPGYKDKGKSDEGIGDLTIWHSILALASAQRQNVLFVSNEQKADWVVRAHEKALCARPELLAEFHYVTGQYFGMIMYSQFLTLLKAPDDVVGVAQSVEAASSKDGADDLANILRGINSLLSPMCASSRDIDDPMRWVRVPDLHGGIWAFRKTVSTFPLMVGTDRTATSVETLDNLLNDLFALTERIKYYVDTEDVKHLHSDVEQLKHFYNLFSMAQRDFLGSYLVLQ